MVNKNDLLTEVQKAVNSGRKTDLLLLKVRNLEQRKEIDKLIKVNRRAKNEQRFRNQARL